MGVSMDHCREEKSCVSCSVQREKKERGKVIYDAALVRHCNGWMRRNSASVLLIDTHKARHNPLSMNWKRGLLIGK